MATAQLDVDSNKFNLPVVKASAGPDGIVVSKLRNDGWVTLDPGFLTTAQCESKITYIDGKHSILSYCGYPIEQLCENSDFLEVAPAATAYCRAGLRRAFRRTSITRRWLAKIRTMGSPALRSPDERRPPSSRCNTSLPGPPIFLTTTSLMRPPRSSWLAARTIVRFTSSVVVDEPMLVLRLRALRGRLLRMCLPVA